MAAPSFEQVYDLALRLSAEERRRLIEELSTSPPSLSAGAILKTLNDHAAEIRAMGVAKIGLFGSYARGDARLDSDIDILVVMANPGYSYFDLFGVQEYLEKLFGVKVDLGPEDALKPAIRPHIMSEVIYAEGI
jgi:uncharacterized protein